MLWFACVFPLVLRLALFTSSGAFLLFLFFSLVLFKCLPHPPAGGAGGARDSLFLLFLFIYFLFRFVSSVEGARRDWNKNSVPWYTYPPGRVENIFFTCFLSQYFRGTEEAYVLLLVFRRRFPYSKTWYLVYDTRHQVPGIYDIVITPADLSINSVLLSCLIVHCVAVWFNRHT